MTGGACVSIYSRNRYQSYDLDFVLLAAEDRKAAARAVAELGFRRDGRHFRHLETPYLIEFLLPPVSIGSEPVREPAAIRAQGRVLKLLSPTDCIKDRLAAYYFWNDRSSLEQALLVADHQTVDLPDIERWSESEGMNAKHSVFLRLLKDRRSRRRKTGKS